MKNFNINNNTKERVEVMALFGYEMTPCEPLSFKRRGDEEAEEVIKVPNSGSVFRVEHGATANFQLDVIVFLVALAILTGHYVIKKKSRC